MQNANIAMKDEAKATRSIRKRAVARTIRVFLLLAALLTAVPMRPSHGQEALTAKAQAPADHAILRSGLGGAYFVTKSLKQRYDNLVKTVRVLEAEINKATIDEEDALLEIRNLREELANTREAVEKQKVFVSPVKTQTQSETTTLDMGNAGCLLIVANKVRIVGWDQPQVKCVLEKTVLSLDDQPADAHFKAIKVVHQHRRAAELVGKTREELEDSRKAQDSAPGAKPPDQKAKEARKKFDEEYLASYSLFRPMQGKEIDVLEIDGLTYEQGNPYIGLEVESPGGQNYHGGNWRRHASLTVYVPHTPRCQLVGVQGGRGGLDVQSLRSSLILRGDGDRDYEGQFRIVGLHGSLTADDVPIQVLENVVGDVSITLTGYGENSGVHHVSNMRTCYTVPPGKYLYKKITGDVRAWFCRADLLLEEIAGTIDVRNEFGDTLLMANKPLAVPRGLGDPKSASGSKQLSVPVLAKAHRVVSESGHIEVYVTEDPVAPLPIPLLALTECGSVRVIGGRKALESTSFTLASGDQWGTRRHWRGFMSKGKGDFSPFAPFERPAEVLLGKDRSPGLDLISRAGSIRIVYGE